MRNIFKYIKTVILIDQFSRDTRNDYLLISQRPYHGKTDANGNIILESGSTVSLQIMHDISEPIVNKKTGEIMENNELEFFEATIVGCEYPLPIKKGEHVRLGGFLQDYSYYIDGKLYLKFSEIERIEKGTE